MPQARLVILESPNGRDHWRPLKPDEVPEWLKAPEVMAKLVEGEMAQRKKSDAGVVLPETMPWYRAQPATDEDVRAMLAAVEKRDRRMAKRMGLTESRLVH